MKEEFANRIVSRAPIIEEFLLELSEELRGDAEAITEAVQQVLDDAHVNWFNWRLEIVLAEKSKEHPAVMRTIVRLFYR